MLFADYTLIIKGERYPCHRFILSSFRFFRDLFEITDASTNTSELEIDINPEAFVYVLDLIQSNILVPGTFIKPTSVSYSDVIILLDFLGADSRFLRRFVELWLNSLNFLNFSSIREHIIMISGYEWMIREIAMVIITRTNKLDISGIPEILPTLINMVLHESIVMPFALVNEPTGHNTIYNAILLYKRHGETSLLNEIWNEIPKEIQAKIPDYEPKVEKFAPSLNYSGKSQQWKKWLKIEPERAGKALAFYNILRDVPHRKHRNQLEWEKFQYWKVKGPAICCMEQLRKAYLRNQKI